MNQEHISYGDWSQEIDNYLRILRLIYIPEITDPYPKTGDKIEFGPAIVSRVRYLAEKGYVTYPKKGNNNKGTYTCYLKSPGEKALEVLQNERILRNL